MYLSRLRDILKLIGRGTSSKSERETHRIYAECPLKEERKGLHTPLASAILQKGVESPFLVGLKFSAQLPDGERPLSRHGLQIGELLPSAEEDRVP